MKPTLVALAIAGLALGISPAVAQQKDTPKAADKAPPKAEAKKEEEPFYLIGRPKSGAGAKLDVVPAFPVPTAADKLPVAKIKLPPGFKVEVYQAGILGQAPGKHAARGAAARDDVVEFHQAESMPRRSLDR